jgi:hypothetical protein
LATAARSLISRLTPSPNTPTVQAYRFYIANHLYVCSNCCLPAACLTLHQAINLIFHTHNTQPPPWGESNPAILAPARQRHPDIYDGLLTAIPVRRSLTSTSSLSATSTPASRPPPDVSLPFRATAGSHILTLGHRLDLQVRWY